MTSYIEAVEKLIDQQDDKSIRIEQLVRQRDGWEETALMYAQNVDFWKSKLAEAVEIGNEMAKSIAGNYYLPGIATAWFAMVAKLGGKYD